MDYRDMGLRIRTLRKKQHITQETLAERLDISPSFLGHIERGTRAASLETLVKLCRVLNTEPNYLLASSIDSSFDSRLNEMDAATREQLAKLFLQGYAILQDSPSHISTGK